jgi:protein-L-isoaspartate(D-aspartate) O-methyltransferase
MSYFSGMLDTYRHKGMRRRMIKALQDKGLTDQRVIEAMEKVPRHSFVDTAFVEHAYEDKAFPIAAGQTISHPSTVAMQSQLLECEPGMKVLEIGTGSGYQAAVLVQMGVKLYTIERQRELFTKTNPLLRKLGYKCETYYGDGYKGKKVFAPFDRIIITCGAPYIPQDLLDQMASNSIMVIPVGEGNAQEMMLIRRTDGKLSEERHGEYRFVPMLEHRGSDI